MTMPRNVSSAGRVRVEPLTSEHLEEFLAAVRRSRHLHGRWVTPPTSDEAFKLYVQALQGPGGYGYAVRAEGDLAGVINLGGVMRGLFQNAFLGYYAFAPLDHRGYMAEALERVLQLAFQRHRLHRLEANIQPDNQRSKALVQGAGFRLEGFSPRYLKIAGRWRDHERWALTHEEWQAARSKRSLKEATKTETNAHEGVWNGNELESESRDGL
jgi:ribosomal-protein-alanine N-acetyltransferase